MTRRELLDTGFTLEQAESSGELTLELRRGRFALRLLGIGQDVWGKYTVRGRVLDYEVEGCRPAGICMEGSVGSFRWSVYRDRLTFERVPGRPGETALAVKPLTRVG